MPRPEHSRPRSQAQGRGRTVPRPRPRPRINIPGVIRHQVQLGLNQKTVGCVKATIAVKFIPVTQMNALTIDAVTHCQLCVYTSQDKESELAAINDLLSSEKVSSELLRLFCHQHPLIVSELHIESERQQQHDFHEPNLVRYRADNSITLHTYCQFYACNVPRA